MPPRCFLALALPDEVMRTLIVVRETIVALDPGWAGEKWVAPDALHITLAFLGPVDDSSVPAIVDSLERAAAEVAGFDLRMGEILAVPSTHHAGMVWAAVRDPDRRVSPLRDTLMQALPTARAADRRPLRPHVTLVRARTPHRASTEALRAASSLTAPFGKDPDGIVSVRSATLFSSTLGAGGPDYREMAVVHLAR